MFGIGTQEMILFGIVAAILFSGRRALTESSLRESMKSFRAGVKRRRFAIHEQAIIVEIVTEQRDTTMKERWKKFLWSPAFWATIGVFGCATGLYFQRVANNGSGLWCLGLVFLGAAYIEKNP